MINAQALLEYARCHRHSGEVSKALMVVAQWMFEHDCRTYGLAQGLCDTEKILLQNKKKIEAIKHYKNRTNCTLKDAKDTVEDFMLWIYGVKSFPYVEV